MGSRRHLTIGITVNLDNYENLRLEMSAEVEGEKDTEELIASLDAILARLGRGTQETAERVDSYRRRVFTFPKETPLPEEAPVPPPPTSAIPVPSPTTAALPTPLPEPGTRPVPPAVILPAVESPAPPVIPAQDKPAAPVLPPSPPVVSPAARTEVTVPPPSPASHTDVTPSPPVKVPAPAPAVQPSSPSTKSQGELSCERCGAPITSVQRKLSRLFQNKDLCKKCLNQP